MPLLQEHVHLAKDFADDLSGDVAFEPGLPCPPVKTLYLVRKDYTGYGDRFGQKHLKGIVLDS